ncbi:hypothetical protein [Collimonas sp.]|jgi:hypothetical protein|uniref:hypothetical protein n=1 Tax=Collimonas sp. TaxID=1963772 RepID=UPI002C21635C|nr:hypothetical protein [Collimonas sp.]HWX01336.1 hypothetical protein [Collimonas sp.]
MQESKTAVADCKAIVDSEAIVQQEASIEDLGLEVVEDTPQIALGRPVRHIRAQ